ncbi:MAG: D-cysteine desulfhydrase family protein [Alphaproteobacteria bacterium]|nr:D-cysteine desulfhydrase family protein [Alphaproteobacteria bacterium]
MDRATTNRLPLTPVELAAQIAEFPRVSLAHLPTPLEHLPRLSKRLGGPEIFIKRDDLTGLAFGGNKTRQLEFVFAEILAQGADTVVCGAYTQSNWCRQITAACRKLGLDCSLVLVHGVKGPLLQGNLFLDKLMGADVEIVNVDHMQDLPPYLEAKVAKLKAAGKRPYYLSPFNLDVLSLSALGYVSGYLELDAQLAERNLVASHLYVAGTMMTPAGLHMAAAALGRPTKVVVVNPSRWDEDRAVAIARIADATAKRLRLPLDVKPADIANEPNYVGEKYGVLTDAAREAIRLLAETEGVILDPVYTGKAMSGLIDHVRKGRLTTSDRVVFVHTGGLPALFAYAGDIGVG